MTNFLPLPSRLKDTGMGISWQLVRQPRIQIDLTHTNDANQRRTPARIHGFEDRSIKLIDE
jgi:hypothetical protein